MLFLFLSTDQSINKHKGAMIMLKKAPVILLLSLLSANAMAQSESTSAAPEQTDIIALRAETQKLERDMYSIFNALNSSDDLDVSCLEKAPTGSTIPVWQCEAAFMKDVKARDVSSRFDNPVGGAANTQNGFIPQSGRQMSFNNRKKAEQLNDEMKALARQHPELASAMLALHAKRQQLEALEK
jgi:hypothetical protein